MESVNHTTSDLSGINWSAPIFSASNQLSNVFEASQSSMATTQLFLRSTFPEFDQLFILGSRLVFTLALLLIVHKV